MNIQQIISPYEIMFRLATSGIITGCHKRELERIVDVDSGTVFATKELDPVAITGDYVSAILGTVNTSLVQTLTARDAEIAGLQADSLAKDDLILQTTTRLDAASAELQQSQLMVQDLQAQLTAIQQTQSTSWVTVQLTDNPLEQLDSQTEGAV